MLLKMVLFSLLFVAHSDIIFIIMIENCLNLLVDLFYKKLRNKKMVSNQIKNRRQKKTIKTQLEIKKNRMRLKEYRNKKTQQNKGKISQEIINKRRLWGNSTFN